MTRTLTAFVCLTTLVACSTRSVDTTEPLRPTNARSKTLEESRRLAASQTSRSFELAEGRLKARTSFGAVLEAAGGRIALAFGKSGNGPVMGLVQAGRENRRLETEDEPFSRGCADAKADDCLERRAAEGLVEGWHNGAEKLEQSIRIERAPEGAGAVRLRMAIDFAAVAVRPAGAGVDLRPVRGPALVYDGLRARDAAGAELAVRFEASANGVDIVLADTNPVYPVLVQSTISKPPLQRWWTGRDAGSAGELGRSVASAGDVDGDGFDDVLVGSADASTPGVLLFLGGPDGPKRADWSIEGRGRGDATTATGIGDLDGDSYGDVAVFGTFGESGLGTMIHLGSTRGLGKSAATFLPGVMAYPLGDLDGDGRADVGELVLADGSTKLRFGAPGGLDTRTVDLEIPGAPTCRPEEACGSTEKRVSEIAHGDFDGDGRQDVALGVPMAGDAETGAVYVYMNGTNGLARTPSRVLLGSLPGAHFGTSVQHARDVDGDGCDDLLIAARPDVTKASAPGASVYLFRGSPGGLQEVSAWKLAGLHGLGYRGPGPSYATVMAGIGDSDGDGFADVVIGAPDEPNALGGTGKVLLFRGGPAGLLPTPDLVTELSDEETPARDRPSGSLGLAVAAAGDVDGDGLADYLQAAKTGLGAADASGGLVCLDGCSGERAPADDGLRRSGSFCSVQERGGARVCGSCTASATQACGAFHAACDEATGGCTACDGNAGQTTPAPCRDAGRPICALTGPSRGACRPACDGNYGADTPGACSSLTPFCERSGLDAGRCVACDGDNGSGKAHACNAKRPRCVASGPAKGMCQVASPTLGTRQSMGAPDAGGAVTRTVRRLKSWWSKL